MPLVDVAGLSMYYEWRGEGPPLVLILGLALALSEAEPVVAGLAASFRVLAFDNRGAGRTESPPGPYTIPQMADDTAGLMDALPVESARIVGISLGATIALDLAIRHPERVRDLVLIGARARSAGPLRMSVPMRLLAPVRRLPPLRGRYPQSREAFEAQRHAARTYDVSSALAGIGARTLLLHGRRDRSAPVGGAGRLARAIPNAQLRTFPGGHLFFLLGSRRDVIDAVERF